MRRWDDNEWEAAWIIATIIAIVCCVGMYAACTPSPAQKAKIWPTGAPSPSGNVTWFWCVAGTRDDGEGLLGCADTQDTCRDEFRAKALKYGGLAHITQVGECERVEIEP